MRNVRRCAAFALGICLANGATIAAADDDSYLRVREDHDGSIALEIATRSFRPAEGKGPTVDLVGVAHIGESGFYRDLQRTLEDYDLVLYESVMPAGARPAGGDDDAERVRSTKASLRFVASFLEMHRAAAGRYPETIDDAAGLARRHDDRLGDWLLRGMTDGWGHPVNYRVDPAGAMYVLASRGADGREGGTGADTDILLSDASAVAPFVAPSDGGLQAELATALGLAFQLEALDYGGASWQCSDMSVDQLERALADRGTDFTPVQGALTGSSMLARVSKIFLRLIRLADALFDGMIADSMKVLLIETLGDEAIVEQSMNQFDPGFAQVIVGERNQVVIDDLRRIIDSGDGPERIAILYGAAHMADMGDRMREQLGYEAADAQWLTAIEVDLAQSALTASDLEQMRTILKQSMRSSF